MLQMEEDAGVHWAPAEESGTSVLHQDQTLDAFDCEFPEDDLDADENEEHDTPTADEEKDRCEAERGEGRDGEPRSRRRGRTRRGAAGAGPVDQAPASAPSHKPILTSGRHKPLRRRAQHPHTQSRARRRHGTALLSACRDVLCSVSPWGLSCVRMLVELIICVTHRCGVAVEAAGLSLYSCGTLALCRISDVPGLTQDLRRALRWGRGWAGAVAEQLVSAVRWARDALQVALALTLAALSTGTRALRHGAHRLSGDRGRRCWSALQSSRVWRKLSDLSASVTGCFCRGGSAAGRSDDGSPSRAAPGEELRRLLALAQVPEDELDPFSVLGVDVQASEAELKRAYRQLAVQVHPDKNKHPGAGEAFKVLRAAWDIVSNPETRREYELKRMAATELSKSMNEFLTKLQDDLKEAMNTMMCTKCEGKHRRFEMDREPAAARFCGECKRWHGAEEGDLWAESSLMGLRITYFAFMDGKVFDITEWAGCQRISISPDTHRVPYHISFGSKGSSGPSRHRSASEASAGGSPADLQDFFSRFFQSGSSSETPANGGFFPAGGAPHTGFFPAAGAHGPGAAGASMFAGAPPQTGVFSGPQRAEAGEHCAEGRAPRRRRKVRKPFQR